MYTVKTEGFVIRSYDYGDGHRVTVLFTREFGRIKAVAKGSRKMKSKFGASLEPLSENRFMLYRKPGQELFTITGCKIEESHSKLREDMELYGYSAMMAEGIDKLCAEEEPDWSIYDLFKQALIDVEDNDAASSAWLFVFRLLKYSGYRMNFFNCTSCAKRSFDDMYFSPENGGVFCPSCIEGNNMGWPISYGTIMNIRKLSPNGLLDPEAEEEIGNTVKKFIKYQFDIEMRSLRFLNLFRKRREPLPVG
jgi:DNA repair protein RecO (recombination protein O)